MISLAQSTPNFKPVYQLPQGVRTELVVGASDLRGYLTRLWGKEGQNLTTAQIGQALVSKSAPPEWLDQWRKDYMNFLDKQWRGHVEQVQDVIRDQMERQGTASSIDPRLPGLLNYQREHGAQLVKGLTDSQEKAIQNLLQWRELEQWSVPELARYIRPIVGLNSYQEKLCQNYYERTKAQLLKDKSYTPESAAEAAQKATGKYAEWQHKMRAANIARTETQRAITASEKAVFADLTDEGGPLAGVELRRIWDSIRSESRTCELCFELDGKTTSMGEPFAGEFEGGDAHPLCLCSVRYEREALSVEVPKEELIKPEPEPLVAPEPTEPEPVEEPKEVDLAGQIEKILEGKRYSEYDDLIDDLPKDLAEPVGSLMYNWTSSAEYTAIREYMLEGEIGDAAKMGELSKADLDRDIRILQSMVDAGRYSGTLYRGLGFTGPESMQEFLKPYSEAQAAGEAVQFQCLAGTSKGFASAAAFVRDMGGRGERVILRIKASKSGLDLGVASLPGEREVLLGTKALYSVESISYDEERGFVKIELKELPQ